MLLFFETVRTNKILKDANKEAPCLITIMMWRVLPDWPWSKVRRLLVFVHSIVVCKYHAFSHLVLLAAAQKTAEKMEDPVGKIWNMSISLEEAAKLPSATSVWDAGENWQQTRAGASLYATLALTYLNSDGTDVNVSSERCVQDSYSVS